MENELQNAEVKQKLPFIAEKVRKDITSLEPREAILAQLMYEIGYMDKKGNLSEKAKNELYH